MKGLERVTRLEFIRELDGMLRSLSDKERLDILADYTTYFLRGIEQGKTEEEIAASLGTPAEVAGRIIHARSEQRSQADALVPGNVRSVLVSVAVVLFNLMFVVGPYVGLIGVLIGLMASSVALVLAPIGMIAGAGIPALQVEKLYVVFGSLAAVGLGGMLGVAVIMITRWVYRLTRRYLQFNLNLIRGK